MAALLEHRSRKAAAFRSRPESKALPVPQSQRDCITQPRVPTLCGLASLPWVADTANANPERVPSRPSKFAIRIYFSDNHARCDGSFLAPIGTGVTGVLDKSKRCARMFGGKDRMVPPFEQVEKTWGAALRMKNRVCSSSFVAHEGQGPSHRALHARAFLTGNHLSFVRFVAFCKKSHTFFPLDTVCPALDTICPAI